jgi:hypothetical protein
MMTWLRCSLFSRLFFEWAADSLFGVGLVGPGGGFSSSTGCEAEKAGRSRFLHTRCRERECVCWSVFLCRSEQVNASRERETC